MLPTHFVDISKSEEFKALPMSDVADIIKAEPTGVSYRLTAVNWFCSIRQTEEAQLRKSFPIYT